MGNQLPPPPGVNPMPFIVAVLIVAVIGGIALKNSWIGQVFTNPPKEDPIASMNFIDARTTIENQLMNGLSSIGAKGTLKYTTSDQPAQKNTPGPVQVTLDTSIKDAEQRKAIVDPIKDYFGPAKITTLTINDQPRHRTWTYSAALVPEADTTSDTTGLGARDQQPSEAAQPQQ